MDNNNQEWQFEADTQAPVDKEGSRGSAITSMVLGILSIVCGTVPGIVLACIARSIAKKFLAAYPESSAVGFAKAGRITGTVGLVVSIVSLVLSVLIGFIYGVILVGLMSGEGGFV